VSDDRVVEYLRERGRVDLPSGFVSSVMSAVEAPAATRSWFAAGLPALATVTLVLVVTVVVLVFGPGRSAGPVPSASAAPSATTSATVEELRAELSAAVEALRVSPGVICLQSSTIGDVLGSAVWFDWRSTGDQVVVQRTDLDVTQSGWWMDPTGSPPAVGERVVTSIYVFIGDQFLFGGPDEWQVTPREEAPPIVSFGTGVLDGAIDPRAMLEGLVPGPPDVASGTLERRVEADGRVTWTVETPWRGGTAVQRWRIAPGGGLEAWTWEVVGATLNPEEDFNGNLTSATLEYEIVADPTAIQMPDVTTIPDPSVFGLPDDFPL
jgi:hypothetical protein